MADCCPPPEPRRLRETCPACERRGKPVSRTTVGSLATTTVDAPRLSAAEYRFCPTPSCPVVYFGSTGVRLERDDVRVRVHKKDDGADVALCYCFGYTRDRLAREGDAALGYVAAQLKAGQCACDVKNPSGRCYLGELRRFLRTLAPGR